MKYGVKIGVKFCGSCNPRIHTGEIFRRIRIMVEQKSAPVAFVSPDTPGISALLVISGCPHDCAQRPVTPLPEVAVSGENLNLKPCGRERLALFAVEELLYIALSQDNHDQGGPDTI